MNNYTEPSLHEKMIAEVYSWNLSEKVASEIHDKIMDNLELEFLISKSKKDVTI